MHYRPITTHSTKVLGMDTTFDPKQHPRNRDGKFTQKSLLVGKKVSIGPSMSERIDIRASLDASPARLVSVAPVDDHYETNGRQAADNGDMRGDYELADGRRVFVVSGAGAGFPDEIDNSTDVDFHEYRLMFLDEAPNDEDGTDLIVGIARIDYSPDGKQTEEMLGVQQRSRTNTGTRLSPIDFGSLDSVFDDYTGNYINYGDCNYNYLLEQDYMRSNL